MSLSDEQHHPLRRSYAFRSRTRSRSPPSSLGSRSTPVVVYDSDDDVREVPPPLSLRHSPPPRSCYDSPGYVPETPPTRASISPLRLRSQSRSRSPPPPPPPSPDGKLDDKHEAKADKKAPRSSWWVATFFSEDVKDWNGLKSFGKLVDHLVTGVGECPFDDSSPHYHQVAKLRHLSYQLEICPETKRTHAHVLCGYHTAQRPAAVQKLLGVKCHVERVRNVARAFAYGTAAEKDGEPKRAPADHFGGSGPFVFGVPVGGQGQRNDLHALRLAVERGISDKGAAEHHTLTVAKYLPFYKHIKGIYDAPVRRLVRCFWLFGPPRVGKNIVLARRYPSLYLKVAGTDHWFDRYNGESVIVINDLDSDPKQSVANLMTWLDGQPTLVAYKGGFHTAKWTVVWVTANTDLFEYVASQSWPDAQKDAFRARFEGVFELPSRNHKFVPKVRRPQVIEPPFVDQMSHLGLP